MENPDLLTSSYDYELDPSLIAARPANPRDESKLLVYYADSDRVEHRVFKELPEILQAEDQIVFNQSKVYPCRILGQKPTGAKAELFLLSLTPTENLFPVMIKSNGKKNIGDKFLCGDLIFEITKRGDEAVFWVSLNKSGAELYDYLEEMGNIPIPPYIRQGKADDQDKKDYQTIYAKNTGSVAAPTAGLHFTQDLFKRLDARAISRAFVTLHVGMGTFRPVQTDNILEHKMHSESFEVDAENIKKIKQAKNRIAVGTTSLRVLESIYNEGRFDRTQGDTDIFLYPGVEVKSIGGIITNFHLPKSTLLMLVSSLVGREKTLELYKLAVEKRYRFYSYGDAMLILRNR